MQSVLEVVARLSAVRGHFGGLRAAGRVIGRQELLDGHLHLEMRIPREIRDAEAAVTQDAPEHVLIAQHRPRRQVHRTLWQCALDEAACRAPRGALACGHASHAEILNVHDGCRKRAKRKGAVIRCGPEGADKRCGRRCEVQHSSPNSPTL